MHIKDVVETLLVPRVGEVELTVEIELEEDAVIARVWKAVYCPAGKDAEPVAIYGGDDEMLARAAYSGAVLVLETLAAARENRRK